MENLSTKRDLKDIETIMEYCDRISKVLSEFGSDEEDFLENYALQSSCAFSLIQIGESVKNLLRCGFDQKYQDIEWSKIAKFRDVIVHHYGKIDLHIVWKTSVHLVPELRIQCGIILEKLKR